MTALPTLEYQAVEALRPFAKWCSHYELSTAGGIRDEVMLASLRRARAVVEAADARTSVPQQREGE